jgi:hypothetical protein
VKEAVHDWLRPESKNLFFLCIMLGLHGDILEIGVENIADIIANCLCVNRVDTSVTGIL